MEALARRTVDGIVLRNDDVRPLLNVGLGVGLLEWRRHSTGKSARRAGQSSGGNGRRKRFLRVELNRSADEEGLRGRGVERGECVWESEARRAKEAGEREGERWRPGRADSRAARKRFLAVRSPGSDCFCRAPTPPVQFRCPEWVEPTRAKKAGAAGAIWPPRSPGPRQPSTRRAAHLDSSSQQAVALHVSASSWSNAAARVSEAVVRRAGQYRGGAVLIRLLSPFLGAPGLGRRRARRGSAAGARYGGRRQSTENRSRDRKKDVGSTSSSPVQRR